jgi:urease accessory protein
MEEIMLRASTVAPAGTWSTDRALDRIVLDSGERFRRRTRMVTAGGIEFLLDLPQATLLRGGDGLGLDDGGVVLVEAAPEALVEVTAERPEDFARLAFHIGNRHVPAEIRAGRIRIQDDRVIVRMLRRMGARVRRLQAPFNPEIGAFAHGDGGHGHD